MFQGNRCFPEDGWPQIGDKDAFDGSGDEIVFFPPLIGHRPRPDPIKKISAEIYATVEFEHSHWLIKVT